MKKKYPMSQQQLSKRFELVRNWFASNKGQKLIALEKPLLDKALATCFGRFLIEVGPIGEFSKPVKDIEIIVKLGYIHTNADIIIEEAAWPVFTESIDVIVLQHALDFAYSPHDLLRESARCIRPGGHVLIVGFNPFSCWGIFKRYHFSVLSKSHSITLIRLKDWLRLLGFTIEQCWKGGYCLPTKSSKEDKLTLLETLGQNYHFWGNGFYLISARKMMLQQIPMVNESSPLLGRLTTFPVVGRNDIEAYERNS